MKVPTVFGTRPEAIKLAPVVGELQDHPEIVSRVCVTLCANVSETPATDKITVEGGRESGICQ